MDKKIPVQPLGLLARCVDVLMTPVMYLVSGTLEKPQKTHRWNNAKLAHADVKNLNPVGTVFCKGISGATIPYRFSIPVFHIPVLGGWRDYVVLEPLELSVRWHVGWATSDAAGVSRIPVNGPARMLVGPKSVLFFGVSVGDNVQIRIRRTGTGRIGDRGPYARIPLF